MKNKYILLLISIIIMSLGITLGGRKLTELDKIQEQFKDIRLNSSFSKLEYEGENKFLDKTLEVSSDIKLKLNVDGKLGTGEMTVVLKNHKGDVIFKKQGKEIKESQILNMPKGKYNLSITLKNATDGTINMWPHVVGCGK